MAQRQKGVVHPLVILPWYYEEFTADLAVAGLPDREKAGYALVMSAIFQLAVIWTKYPAVLDALLGELRWTSSGDGPTIGSADRRWAACE